MQPNVFDGPIPGANFTSDERNWPWHRAPDITDLDEAVEFVAMEMAETPKGFRYMNMIESGVTIATVTDILVTIGIGNGKWTPDFALLAAGPIARMLEIMAKGYGIEYDLGIEELSQESTAAFYKEARQMGAVLEEELAPEDEEPPEEPAGGIMAPSSEEEQQMMLGYSANEEPVEDGEEA